MIKIDNPFLSKIIDESRLSPRKRKNYNFHKVPEDKLHRMIHGMEPGTYVQPHKHENPDKREAFIILKGSVAVIEYDESGNVVDYTIMKRETGNFGVEIPPRTYHSLICLELDSVIYEVKDGPYNPDDDKCFASWAPREGDPGTDEYTNKILSVIGQR